MSKNPRNKTLRNAMAHFGINPGQDFGLAIDVLAQQLGLKLEYRARARWKDMVYAEIVRSLPDCIERVVTVVSRDQRLMNSARAETNRSNPNKAKQSQITAFYKSWEWKRLRYDFLKDVPRRCGCCGATPADGTVIVVDHIKPIRHNWHLRLNKGNLQILCDDCNMGKGSRDDTDWRTQDARIEHGRF